MAHYESAIDDIATRLQGTDASLTASIADILAAALQELRERRSHRSHDPSMTRDALTTRWTEAVSAGSRRTLLERGSPLAMHHAQEATVKSGS